LVIRNASPYSAGVAADDSTIGVVIDEDESLLEESPLRKIDFILDMTLLSLFFSPPVAGASVAIVASVLAMSTWCQVNLNQY